jgi:hypothetical protein
MRPQVGPARASCGNRVPHSWTRFRRSPYRGRHCARRPVRAFPVLEVCPIGGTLIEKYRTEPCPDRDLRAGNCNLTIWTGGIRNVQQPDPNGWPHPQRRPRAARPCHGLDRSTADPAVGHPSRSDPEQWKLHRSPDWPPLSELPLSKPASRSWMSSSPPRQPGGRCDEACCPSTGTPRRSDAVAAEAVFAGLTALPTRRMWPDH